MTHLYKSIGWRNKRLAKSSAAMRGVAAVEFGILLPIMILMVFGISEFGRAIYEYNALAKSVRDVTRLLTQNAPGNSTYPTATQTKCLVVYGNSSCTPPKLVAGLDPNMVYVCNTLNSTSCPGKTFTNVATGSGSINLVEVKIDGYVFNSLVPFITNNIPFGDISVTMRQS